MPRYWVCRMLPLPLQLATTFAYFFATWFLLDSYRALHIRLTCSPACHRGTSQRAAYTYRYTSDAVCLVPTFFSADRLRFGARSAPLV